LDDFNASNGFRKQASQESTATGKRSRTVTVSSIGTPEAEVNT
jgi:hypothetical protein